MDKTKQKKINNNNRKRGGAFEKKVADYLGFEVVPYSGSNARFGYGDVRNEEWLIECKNITPIGIDGKITIKQLWFDKNRERADDVNKGSCIAWMPCGRPDKFIIMEYNDFIKLNIKSDQSYILMNKSHNTKNVILYMEAYYVKYIRNGEIFEIISLGVPYYMMSLSRFRDILRENDGDKYEL